MKPREWLWLIPVLIGSAVAAHFLTLRAFPERMMQAVIDRTGRDGQHENTLVHGAPVTPASRAVVRPSPDLVYSICAYNLDVGPVEIAMTRFEAYHSLSLYDARTNNYYTVNDREYDGEVKRVRLVADDLVDDDSGSSPDSGAAEARAAETVVSPTRQGVALVRRLASPETLLRRALEIRQQDSCRPAGRD